MRILIIGGTGLTGKLVIDEALSRGHKLTALVRNPSGLSPKSGLTIISGSPLEASAIEEAFTALEDDVPDAVIVTLASPKVKGTRLMADVHMNLIPAMKKHGVTKIATLQPFGVGSSLPNISVLMRFAIGHTAMGYSWGDHNLVDAELKKSDLDFVLPRAVRLTNGEKAPVKSFGNEGLGMGAFAGMGGISRASVAAFLIDAVEMDKWNRSTPVISN